MYRAAIFSVREIFQFTPLREGRLAVFIHENSANIFQFTPLREGRRME